MKRASILPSSLALQKPWLNLLESLPLLLLHGRLLLLSTLTASNYTQSLHNRAKPAPGTRNTSTSDFYDAVDHSSDFDPETNSFTPKPSTPTPAVVAPLNDETHYPSLESSAHIVPESSSSFPNNATASNNASKRKQRQLAAAQAAAQSVPRVPDHLILGSSALDPDYVPDISHPHALPPFPYTSPYAAGYTLGPRYTGLFDPFSGQSKLSSVLIANTRVVGPTPTTAATTAAVPSPSSEPVIVSAKSRYERLFDAPEQVC